jgi:mannose-1-phosphate guanylyltransferase
MVPIMNVPFLERTLTRLRDAGIKDIILPAGYLPEAITGYFGDGSRLGIKLTYVIEDVPMGTAGALKNIADHITGRFFVLNGDILTSLDLKAMLAAHEAHGGIGTLHLIRVDDPSAFGCVVNDENGRITAFVEKPPREEAPTNEINAGTYLLEREVLDLIPAGRAVSIERETFPLIIAGPRPMYAYTTDDYWIDLGKPEAYAAAHRHILTGTMLVGSYFDENGIGGPGSAAVKTRLAGPAYIGRDVTIEESAHVGPGAILGDGCAIGADAHVEDSVLWDGVHVGAGARILGAIIASNARIGAGATIMRGSVIGHGTVVEPNTIVEEGSRLRAVQPAS